MTVSNTPATPITPAPKRRRWPLYLGGAFIALMLFSGIGFVAASALEEHDTFCISCHTVPETTYFNRAYLALDNPKLPVDDLSSAHYHLAQQGGKEAFACIDCHRGDGSLPHRVSTLLLAGRDTITLITGRENPEVGKINVQEGWLPNAACVGCHTETLLMISGLENHFHSTLPQAKQALDKGGKITISDALKSKPDAVKVWSTTVTTAPVTCTSCHLPHSTIPNGKATFYIIPARRNEACVSCHVVVGKGPQKAEDLPQ